MNALELEARIAWVEWGAYAKFTFCSCCRERTYCRGQRGSWLLCVDCFDLTVTPRNRP